MLLHHGTATAEKGGQKDGEGDGAYGTSEGLLLTLGLGAHASLSSAKVARVPMSLGAALRVPLPCLARDDVHTTPR